MSTTANWRNYDPNRRDAINLQRVQPSGGPAEITGNYLVGNDIFLYRVIGANVANNTIVAPAYDGIAVGGNDDSITISGNTITNPKQEAIVVGDLGFNYPTPAPNSNVTVSNNTVTA